MLLPELLLQLDGMSSVFHLQGSKLFSHGNYIRDLNAAELEEMGKYKKELIEFKEVGGRGWLVGDNHNYLKVWWTPEGGPGLR